MLLPKNVILQLLAPGYLKKGYCRESYVLSAQAHILLLVVGIGVVC